MRGHSQIQNIHILALAQHVNDAFAGFLELVFKHTYHEHNMEVGFLSKARLIWEEGHFHLTSHNGGTEFVTQGSLKGFFTL